MLLKQCDDTAVPRRVDSFQREQRAGGVEHGVVEAVERAIPARRRYQQVRLRQRLTSARETMAGERILRRHSATPSRRTASINGVSRHTGWVKMAGVTTDGEMKTLNY